MNVGDYVRTKYGITQYREYDTTKGKLLCMPVKNGTNGMFANMEDIIKSSPNIIDLIEEHDLVKIEEQKGIYTICEVERFKEPYTNYKFLGVRLENQPIARKLYELNIKSIVTKEQFKSYMYKVGD